MMKKLRIILPLIVPILSIFYACGDYFAWWDNLSGRLIAVEGLKRLSSPKGFPEIIISDDEAIFRDLFKFIVQKTDNNKICERLRNGKSPSAIVRIGGTLSPDVGSNLPPDWPNPKFAPASSPIAVVYNYRKPYGKIESANIEAVGNLGNLRDWIADSRNSERFYVASLLLGLLSVVVIVMDFSKSNSRKKN
jgi:hypothetical protein